MGSAMAESRRMWSTDSILRFAVVVAIVVSGIDLLRAAVYLLTSLAGWRVVDFSWRFYVEPVFQSAIVFVVVLAISTLLLRVVHRRQGQAPRET